MSPEAPRPRRWTEAEVRLLAQRGPDHTARLTGRTRASVDSKLSKLYKQDPNWRRRFDR